MKTNGTLSLIIQNIFSWFDSLAGVGERKKTPTTHEVFTCARDIFYLTTPKPAQVDNCAISIQLPLRYTGDLIVTNAALQ